MNLLLSELQTIIMQPEIQRWKQQQLINQLINAMEQVSQSNQCIGMSTEITGLGAEYILYTYLSGNQPGLKCQISWNRPPALKSQPARKPGKLEALFFLLNSQTIQKKIFRDTRLVQNQRKCGWNQM
ncbi:Hypothetical_protein [Hexamita inflata]|uniref:Hypothetical_protein n=1 Tax=Hexamita inflata TaxID=28002 RepID=A0AA86REN5_9EUKA|nr:Hypothetical protein HINF_LOCUS59242 [Hexamita inflata]